MTSKYEINDIVEVRKSHAYEADRFKIIRMGAGIHIECEHYQRSVMIPRQVFSKKVKKVLESRQDKES